ncbi:MAG: MFS transporter [Pseudomonadota bacterium]
MQQDTVRRYVQLAVLILAGGAIYPLIYLRQNFEVSILESFNITIAQLGECYSLLGVLFIITYLPSGWLADRVAPRWLMTFSLAATGALGLWFASLPSFDALRLIFIGWGIATGLTFWAALIKGVAVLAHHDEQGRFFGLLDGGRGLVEAILATIAVAIFAASIESLGDATDVALQKVIYLYVGFLFLAAALVLFTIDDSASREREPQDDAPAVSSTGADLMSIVRKPEIWLSAFCILCGYQLFWATYSFSGYLQGIYGLSAVAAGSITVAKLWTRALAAPLAGFVGDKLSRESVLAGLMLAATVSLAVLIVVPQTAGVALLLGLVLAIGLLTYAVRGIYWATLDSCNVETRIKGLAIGVISLVGYAPDVYLPLINGYLLETYPGKTGYEIYFGGIVLMGVLGTLSAWRLGVIVLQRETE